MRQKFTLIELTRFVFRLFVAVILLSLFSSCVARSRQPIRWSVDSVELVWPSPPAQARIKYLRSLHGTTDFSSNNTRDTFFRWISGEKGKVYSLLVPFGVTADGDGRVWVTDPQQHAIFCFDLRLQTVKALRVLSGQSLLTPTGIAYDLETNSLCVADSGRKTVYMFTPEGELLGERIPSGGYGRPGGVVFDAASNLYVADVSRHRVLKFDVQGTYLGVIEGQQAPEYSFNSPAHLSVDKDQNLYVTDSMNFRVEKFDAGGQSVRTFGKIGDVSGSFARPRGVAVDSAGHVYVADAILDNVQIFNQGGQLLLSFGETGTDHGKFSLPAGLFVDQHDRLYVVDSYNMRVEIFQYLSE